MEFQLESDFKPTGDQPEAIRQLTAGLERGDYAQTLLGVTGSGKTFTVAIANNAIDPGACYTAFYFFPKKGAQV